MNTNDPEVLKAVAIQQEQFESRMASLHGRRDVLEQRILQIKEQAVGAETRLAAVIDQIKVLESDLKNYEALSKKGLARKTDTNQLRRTLIELEGNRGSLVSEIARIKQSEIETKIEIMNISKEFDERINEEMKNVSLQLSDLQEKIKSQQDIQDRSVIKAPSSGIIANTKLHTVGGVIPAQQPLMEIIPQDDQLVIEAVLMPQDIEPVHVGAEAKINLSAFKSRLVPKVEGIVTYVAPDVSTDPRPGMGPEMQGRPYYLVRLEVPKKELERLAYKIDLYPGMPAEVFIVTGSRTMLEYMLTPLKESFSRAFIER
jgi:HlyD family type I secretion membrane fusion protein